MAHKIIQETGVSVIRGNASEIFSLVSSDVKTRGVDSSLSVDRSMIEAAKKIPAALNAVIGISGKDDMITDGKRSFCVSNGHPLMTRVTGVGCGLSAVVAAFCAQAEGDLLPAATAAHGFYGLCGELAYASGQGPGSFFVRFLDLLCEAGEKEITAGLKITQVL
jgi:hydroxyethylthiazole kinase